MADSNNVYLKIGRDGELIERVAHSPSDHVNFQGTGWVLKGSDVGKQLTSSKKFDASGLPASSVAGHAAAANTNASGDAPTASAKDSNPKA